MQDKNSESVVQIDENNLDKECIRLPGHYLKYAHQSAGCKRDVAEAEAQLSVIQADLAKEIRANPESFGIEKITEAAITATVISHAKYRKQQEAVQYARYQADLSQAVVWALEHKKRSLTLLVELHGMGYFSNPKVSERGQEAVENMSRREHRRRISHTED